MSRQIEQSLLSLMPSYGSDLPPQLIQLGASLFAQSKIKASVLKPEEEVARLYACTHLACDRLKIALDLPPIQARPPIPPRLYNKLFAYFNTALPDTTRTPTRARARRAPGPTQDADTEQRPLPSRHTPTKEQSLASLRPRRAAAGGNDPEAHLGPWVKPVVSFICAESKRVNLASTVAAGIDYIVAPLGRRTQDPWVNSHLTALVGAVYFFAAKRTDTLRAGLTQDSDDHAPDRKDIVALLKQAREEVDIANRSEEEAWGTWTEIKTAKALNVAIDKVQSEGWLEADWYRGIDDVVGIENGGLDAQDAELAAPIQVRRADTMHQEMYDYLSEARTRQMELWKADMLVKLTEAKKSLPERMEVDGESFW